MAYDLPEIRVWSMRGINTKGQCLQSEKSSARARFDIKSKHVILYLSHVNHMQLIAILQYNYFLLKLLLTVYIQQYE